jgi:adenylate cyclase
MAVPLLRDNRALGSIVVRRSEVRPFEDRHIALLKTFADQAAIAIENARLLNELRQRTDDLSESLEQQTATSEVLKVISSSPGELQPVFEAMLANATRICEAKFGILYEFANGAFRALSSLGIPPAFERFHREARVWGPDTGLGQLAHTRQTVHVRDTKADRAYAERDAGRVAAIELGGVRTFVAVPMLKEGELVGAFSIYRQEVLPFTDKQIELVQNFAAQAVIAIENARLLNEVRTLNQQLEQRVDEQVGEIERMGRLRRFLSPQVADLIVSSGNEKQLESHRREISALFCDLRGFTGFSESSDPEDVMALLREYHKAIGEIIFRHGGTLERFAGDGVMVIFGDPVPLENPALAAVQMALEMRAAITALIERWHRLGHDLGFGIGIAQGYATLGTIGFEGRFDYAAIGTVSNVASRLCDEAQPGQILISPRVLLAVEEAVSVAAVAEMSLKGIRRPIQVHNVVSSRDRQ